MVAQVALVSGASSGIGRAAAFALHERGFAVYGAARRVERMEDLRDAGMRSVRLDVTDEVSVDAAVSLVEQEAGRVDVLVNNAGYGSYGAVEDVPIEEGRRQFDVNVFGAMRLTRRVIPIMRRQGSGRVLNVTSVGGKVHTLFGAWYHGSKFALEGMSDALRIELKPFGIDVAVIEPGAIRTEWGDIASDRLLATSGGGAYATAALRVSETMFGGAGLAHAADPAVVGRSIAAAATDRRPRTRYAVGFGARPVLVLRRLLPDRAFDALVVRSVR